jgi:ABC-2 type transport system permease protein
MSTLGGFAPTNRGLSPGNDHGPASRVGQAVVVVRHAVAVGAADRRALFSWPVWMVVWFTRVVAEVSFFALVGRLLESPDDVAYMLVGSSVLMAATTVLFCVQSTAWERLAGTLPLLVASPTGLLLPLLGRSLMWIPDALVLSFAGLVLGGRLFDVDLPAAGLLAAGPLLLACIVGTYGLGAFVGALVVRTADARNLASGLVRSVMLLATGASVPLAFFPDWVGWLSRAFPATFALRGVREVLAGEPLGATLSDMGWCLAVGAAWLLVAALVVERFVARGRADGSIDAGAP